MSTGEQINRLVTTLELDATTTSKWAKVQSDLTQFDAAYDFRVPCGNRVVDNPAPILV